MLALRGHREIDQQIRTLVREMATANPLWGAPRIHGELRTLGVHVSERTVSRLLEPHTRPSPQTWKTFLTNHLASAASMDFFTVPTLTGRVLFVVIVLSHVRRRIVHFNITEHPTAEWTAQQVVDAFPDDTAPKWLHRDRDSVYGETFRRRVAGMGIAEVVSAPASPDRTPLASWNPAISTLAVCRPLPSFVALRATKGNKRATSQEISPKCGRLNIGEGHLALGRVLRRVTPPGAPAMAAGFSTDARLLYTSGERAGAERLGGIGIELACVRRCEH